MNVKLQNYKKKPSLRLIVLLISAIVVFIAMIVVRRPISTYTVNDTTIYDSFQGEGIFVLNEAQIFIDATRDYYISLDEGQKVRKDASVGYYVTDEYTFQVSQLKEIESRINNLEERQPSIVDISDLSYIEEQLEERALQLNDLLAEGNYEAAESMYNEMGILAEKRYEILYSISDTQTEILLDLQDEKARLENDMGIDAYITSPIPGIISYYSDGEEGKVTPDNILEMDSSLVFDYYNRLKTQEQQEGLPHTLRVIDNFEWMVLIPINFEQFQELKDLSKVDLQIGDDIVPCTVETIKGVGDERLFCLTSSTDISALTGDRIIEELSVITKDYEGFGIPVDAIRYNEDGEMGVILQTINAMEWAPITIIGQDSEMAIVEGLERFDEVVLTNVKIPDSGEDE